MGDNAQYTRREMSPQASVTPTQNKNNNRNKRGASIGQRVGLSDKDTQKLNKMYCDADNSNFEADEPQKPKKKKKPKNKPFDGHGLGYDKGKTVVIKLPASESVKLPQISTIHPFDYFSTAPKTVSSPQAEVAIYGEEVVYPYLTPKLMTEYKILGASERPDDAVILLNMEPPRQASQDIAPMEERKEHKAHWVPTGINSEPQKNNLHQSEESLADAYEKLAETVKAHVYPKSKGYSFKINKDYSKFFQPSEYNGSDEIKKVEERFRQTNAPPRIPIRVSQDNQNERKELPISQEYEDTDTMYRTSLPIGKPYSAYEPLTYGRPEFLKDRQDYSHSSSYLYSPRTTEEKRTHGTLKVESPLNHEWFKKDSYKYTPLLYADYGMEHKSNEPRLTEDYDESTESPRKNQAYSSAEYYDYSSEVPKKQISQAYAASAEHFDDIASTQKTQTFSLYGASAPLAKAWYKPNSSHPRSL